MKRKNRQNAAAFFFSIQFSDLASQGISRKTEDNTVMPGLLTLSAEKPPLALYSPPCFSCTKY